MSVNSRHVLVPFPLANTPDRRTNGLQCIIRHIHAKSGERNFPFCDKMTGTRIGRLASFIDISSLQPPRYVTSENLRINRPSSVAMFPQGAGLGFSSSSSFNPFNVISFFALSFHLFVDLPLCLFPGTGNSAAFLG